MFRTTLIAAALAIFASATGVQASEAELWKALRGGGHVVLMRHAIAPGTGDPANFQIGDCATQRNLDDTGRAQARATGAALRDNGVTEVEVRASQWCRTTETAELLGLGPVIADPHLNSFFSNRDRAPEQTAAVRATIATVAPGSPTRVLVTHQVNITALTGVYPRSGEIVVVRPTPEGGEAIGRLGPFGR